ncbi:unnamed protein product [Psylliodes chrysocephalus]|uniref:Uncharacterized protein n=1 Tax=Psylliodes chrysocephalus TaxID=3402493 RepID=A0A9P0D543_9CUCU|nr:unnamed protein product [Psylliodes chrysocephala]
MKEARKTGNDCKCKYKCFERVTEEDRVCILKKFNEINDKILRDTYLSGLNSLFPVSRVRTKDGSCHSRTVRNKYTEHLGEESNKVCKKAFCALHGISTKTVERLAMRPKQDDCLTSSKE